MIKTECGCGCRTIILHKPLFPSQLKIQGTIRYVKGHQSLGKKLTPEQKQKCAQKLSKNGRWKGGRMVDCDGYVLVKVPNHPFARKAGYVLEHRLIMEKHVNRFLNPNEIVHHKNSNRSDNRIENLMLLNGSDEHVRVERTGKKYPRKNGIWFICETCHNEFYRSNCWRNKRVRWCSWECRYSI